MAEIIPELAKSIGTQAVPANERRAPAGGIKTVVLDIGGVLVGFDFREFIMDKVHDEELTLRIIKDTVKSPWWKEYDRGNMTDEEIMDRFCEGDPEMAETIRSTFADIHGMLTRREETIPWIRALEQAGYRVLVLSNYSSRALEGCPEANDFLPYVDGGILSFLDHLIKPDEEIYRLIMERYSLQPGETVFVDDTVENIDAALALGWKGVVWHDRAQVENDLHALGVLW
ncbi:MAG: HAD family phosphatase [Lachnospiraceae bacterium]|nr:HAD family phosphatase [Lachnospiraceae bacterium]